VNNNITCIKAMKTVNQFEHKIVKLSTNVGGYAIKKIYKQ
jgi:hypothetical protein